MDVLTVILVLGVACLSVELANSAFLIRILLWTANAGKRIIGSIEKALHLKRGKKGSILKGLAGLLGGDADEEEGGDSEIDLNDLAKKLGLGKGADLQALAAKYLAQPGAAEGLKNHPLYGLMNRLGKGENPTFDDMLPLGLAALGRLVAPGGAGQAGQPQAQPASATRRWY